MSDPHVILDSTQEGVSIIRLNRPEVHNAIGPRLVEEMHEILDELRGADGVRCVFLEGKGKSFSAGADLDHMRRAADFTHAENVGDAKQFAHMLRKIRELPMPTVALVNGPAIAGGLGLVSTCDIAVAVRSAFFCISEARLGLIPAMISPYVIEAMGPRAARRYFTTAERFGAEEAHRIGLIHILVDDMAGLAAEAERLAGEFFQNAPHATTEIKKLIDDVIWREVDSHMINDTSKRIADRRTTDEGKEGTTAFLEKRKPSWNKE